MSDRNRDPALPAMVAAHIPIGWTVDHYTPGKPGDHLVVRAGHLGYVTLDFKRRGFRLGVSISGPTVGDATYTGAGWRDRLVADAVTALAAPRNAHRRSGR